MVILNEWKKLVTGLFHIPCLKVELRLFCRPKQVIHRVICIQRVVDALYQESTCESVLEKTVPGDLLLFLYFIKDIQL